MSEDPRCCGTGTCIISADGLCWCGQQWDGEKMCFPKLDASASVNINTPHEEPARETAAAFASAAPKA